MKHKTARSHALIIAIMATLPLLFWNCSGQVGSPASGGDASADASAINPNYTRAPGTSGSLPALQDIYFQLAPTGGTAPFTASGVPSWATFDASTGVVKGAPLKMSDGATITLRSANGNTYGPYTVSVIGNPLKEFQWHLTNTGQTAFALTPGTAGEDIHMSSSVALGFSGSGVRIAFSDTGVYVAHEGLAPNLLVGESRNYLLSTSGWAGDPTPDLSGDAGNAHGTAVATLAVERGWTGKGGRGVAPMAKFAGFLYLEAQDTLTQQGRIDEALGDQFTGNFDVFNYSWNDPQCALTEYSQTLKDKIRSSVLSQRGGKGSLHMMAAGNFYYDDITSCYPSMSSATVYDNVNFSEINTTPYVMNVAAVNALGVSSSYSSPGSAIWISSPGGEFGWDTSVANEPSYAFMPAIIAGDWYGCSSGIKTESSSHSAFDRGSSPNSDCHHTSTMNGTSAATPVATGAVALILQANPNLTWRDVKYILAKTADKVNPTSNPSTHPDSTLNLAGHAYDQPWVTNAAGFNFHNYYGFGRINVDRAVAMAYAYTPGTLGTYQETNWVHDSGSISIAIPDNNPTGISRTLSVTQNLHIEAVQLRLSTTGCAGDLGVELTSPSGTKSVIMNYNSRIVDGAIADHTFLSNAFLGEPTAGTWTLTVLDAHAGCSASLTNWKLNFAGH